MQDGFYCMTLGYSVFDIFMVMYLGNEIELSSDELSFCVYESNWIEQTEACKMCIIILMERLKRPQELVVGKLYPLNLLTFTSVIVFLIKTGTWILNQLLMQIFFFFIKKRQSTVPTACSIFWKTFAEKKFVKSTFSVVSNF